MATYKIKCSVCSEELGTVIKENISQEDRDMYDISTKCSNNHENSVELVEQPTGG